MEDKCDPSVIKHGRGESKASCCIGKTQLSAQDPKEVDPSIAWWLSQLVCLVVSTADANKQYQDIETCAL
jgi:hypothetical protein